MERIRVILSLRPGRFREILKTRIEQQPDMEVVGELADLVHLLLGVAESEADVVILTSVSEEMDPGVCSHLLGEYPHLVILALNPERRVAIRYRRVATREVVPEVSEESIVSLIRNSINDGL